LEHQGSQPGDPFKLGEALVQLAGIEVPPKLFVAGGDALSMIAPAVEARLHAVYVHEALNRSTDGDFRKSAEPSGQSRPSAPPPHSFTL
jgi:hypothetical protein